MDIYDPNWPFAGPRYGELQTYQNSVEDRLNAVRRMDKEALLAALNVPDLQKTVERAIRSRLKKLEVTDER